MLLRRFTLLITAAILSVTTLYANDFRYELSPYIGKNFMDDNYRMEDSTVLGLNFDTYLNDHFGLRVGYERLLQMDAYTDSTKTVQSDDASMNRFYFNGLLKQEFEESAVTPYLFGGVGYESCEDNDCPSEWFKNIGLGVGVDLSTNFRISPEVKAVIRDRDCGDACSDQLTDYVATIGATYLFGAPKVVEKVIKENVIVEKIVPKEVPVEIQVEVPVEICKIPTNFKDRCDNSYYIQIASLFICPTCEVKIRDKRLRKKLSDGGYQYELYETTSKDGDRIAKVLIGPYRCKRDAYAELCAIKKAFECDAFIYSK